MRIGTRGSPLALYQANLVQRLLCDTTGCGAENFLIEILQTSGDTIQGDLKDFGGKGLFTKELETALLDGTIDLAVHSMKDVATIGHEALIIPCVLERADARDAFISRKYSSIEDLPNGALIGSASIRRRAQLAALRPDLQFCLLRGNVGTRLRKLDEGVCDATMLACAGLRRLNAENEITQAVEVDKMLPAPAQGTIGIEIRKDNVGAAELLTALNHDVTQLAITAERAFLKALDGSCRTPIAALAIIDNAQMHFRGEVIAKDGSLRFTRDVTQPCLTLDQAYNLGYTLGQSVRDEIGDRIIFDD
ncbi:MAG: hydroxymethylbilane synthase [Litorimonas sp.]